jgi:hypothetical protein
MEKISVIDNFFSNEIIEDIKNKIQYEYKWYCHCYSREYQNRLISEGYWTINLFDNFFFSEFLNKIIKEKLMNNNLILHRLLAVSQTFGQDICYHVDDYAKNNKFLYENGQDFNSNQFTFCLYINDYSPNDLNGNIQFKIPNEKYIISVEPLCNRAIFFPAYYFHSPLSCNNIINHRICITWKYYDPSKI